MRACQIILNAEFVHVTMSLQIRNIMETIEIKDLCDISHGENVYQNAAVAKT